MIRKSIFILLTVSFSVLASAQTPEQIQKIVSNYDLEKSRELQVQLAETQTEEKEKAIRAAQTLGWPLRYETEDGGWGELAGLFPDGTPYYNQSDNRSAGITVRVDRIHTGGAAGLNLDGQDMVVGVWDGGKVRDSHELFEGRATQMDGASTDHSHATHVAGTVIGSGAFQNGSAKGMAPMASTINYDSSDDLSELATAATDHGLLVSNHSYGIPAWTQQNGATDVHWLGKYINLSAAWDNLAYNYPYLLAVTSAGNSRNVPHANQGDGGFDLLTGSAVSKNNLVVAASYQVLNYTSPASVAMSPFSSWGPTDDGRIKPDITAKGVNTYSATAGGDATYGNMSGTSMSAPSAAGAAILLQQHYNDLNEEFMRSSTLRGLIIHTADEAGTSPGPDYRFGWGLLNAERAAQVISDNGTTSHIIEHTMQNGEGYTIHGTAVPGERLVATICWTDLPGVANTSDVEDEDIPVLRRDVDLRIIDPNNQVHMPWVLNHYSPAAAATRGDNSRDNVEKVEIDSPIAGDYRITLTHKNSLIGSAVVSVIISGMEGATLSAPNHEVDKVTLFPNPTADKLHLHAQSELSEIEVVNMLGQTVARYAISGNTAQIDVSQLQAGTYFAKIIGASGVQTYKFVKR